jgi:hypothetical protein
VSPKNKGTANNGPTRIAGTEAYGIRDAWIHFVRHLQHDVAKVLAMLNESAPTLRRMPMLTDAIGMPKNVTADVKIH